jgi:hypothetical protein
MDRRILFSFLINNGIIPQKYPISIAFQLGFKEMLAKGNTGRAVSVETATCRRKAPICGW